MKPLLDMFAGLDDEDEVHLEPSGDDDPAPQLSVEEDSPIEVVPSLKDVIFVTQREDEGLFEHEIVGEAARLLDDPTFEETLAQRAAFDAPSLRRKKKSQVLRDWEVSTGPVIAPAGEVTLVTLFPQVYFRGEKLIATDNATPAGTGTRVQKVMVGQQVQRPAYGAFGSLTAVYAQNAFGNGNLWNTCQPGMSITLEILFLQKVTFEASIFGTAVRVG